MSRLWPKLRKAIPYLGTAVRFAIIFRLIPIADVASALAQGTGIAILQSLSAVLRILLAVESLCLTR
jgi:hypothetical protein